MPAWRNLKSRVAIQHAQMVHWKMPVQAARLSFDTTAKMILQEGSTKQGGEFENIVLIVLKSVDHDTCMHECWRAGPLFNPPTIT